MKTSKEIINDLFVQVFNNILIIEESYLRDKGATDLSISEIHVLEAVIEASSNSMSDIASFLGITVGSLTISVNRLVEKGYVIKNKDNKDKRKVLVTLTDEGVNIFDVHKEFHDLLIDNVLTSGIKELDIEILSKSLYNLKEFFLRIKKNNLN